MEGKGKMTLVMEPIGVIRSCFKEKFGIPRQAGLVQTALARIVLFAPFGRDESLKDLEMFSHIWVQFYFHGDSDEGWKSTVRPPGLGGRQRVGVFASRSPHRPNHIGLSAVRLLDIDPGGDGASLLVGGGDFLDGSPVLDIKPYLVYSDCIGYADPGYATAARDRIDVVFSKQADDFCVAYRRAKKLDLRGLIIETLRQDPRPASQKNREKIFGIRLWGVNVRWLAQPGVFTVMECSDLEDGGMS